MIAQEKIDYVINFIKKNVDVHYHYHSYEHTQYVFKAAQEIIAHEKLSKYDTELILMAALFHDTGFIYGNNDHEENSCIIAANKLKEWDYDDADIRIIEGIIMATKIPQNPKTHLEEILADADLEYLGTDMYEEISEQLYQELLFVNKDLDKNRWLDIQISFMKKHHFFTTFCKENRSAKKQENLQKLVNDKT
jgi:uncharacterized protein